MTVSLVLASASPARLTTLRSAGVEPEVIVSSVDEPAVVAAAEKTLGTLDPADVALLLARAKGEDVASQVESDSLVLGCDSVLEFDGETFGKPVDADQATARWQAMRGGSGTLHTGHWLVDARDESSGATFGVVASTVVHFADLTDDEVDAYVATGEPLHVAGAFTIDGLGGPYVTRIEGDHHNVVGLSLPVLREMLAEVGVGFHDLRG
ncbi:Maf family protein [Flexivirga meconopsidis]|uniref:Maf family protein n=1 Tax=Flexivirga meconopsidis TaxID=2977121 RepID=UPI002240BCEE|nr:nucleoside triphosphate pyrophosphatase [Flexivirga meconopsidis]